jgi:hypothetical protein
MSAEAFIWAKGLNLHCPELKLLMLLLAELADEYGRLQTSFALLIKRLHIEPADFYKLINVAIKKKLLTIEKEKSNEELDYFLYIELPINNHTLPNILEKPWRFNDEC